MNPPQCCAQIQNISKLAEDCCTLSSGLKGLAENGWIAAFAYFFAFMPWGIIYAFDFIGNRWKTIHKTRKEGIWHIVLTLIPLSYVLFYAYLQFAAENYQEMAAALAAAVLSVLHVLRTIWGLVQLSAFEDWNFRALQCISNMGYSIKRPDDDIDSCNIDGNTRMDGGTAEARRGGGAKPKNEGEFCDEKTLLRTVTHRMIVNNTMIDNVFYGADLPVRLFSFNWAAFASKISRGGLFSDFLTCRKPEECTIRWSVAFLSRFGSQWLTDCKPELSESQEFYSPPNIVSTVPKKNSIWFSRNLAVFAFLHVANDVSGQNLSVVSPGIHIRNFSYPSGALDLKDISDPDSCFPYRRKPNSENVLALVRLKLSIRDAKSSWDTSALNELNETEYAAVNEVSAEQIASFLYIFDKNPRSSRDLCNSSVEPDRLAEALFMKQLNLASPSAFADLKKAVPIPAASFYVPLWSDQFANRLVLQASAHVDNWISLNTGEEIEAQRNTNNRLAFEAEHASDNLVFQRQESFELGRLRSDSENIVHKDHINSLYFLGCMMETVRSKIAEWILNDQEGENWTPDLTRPVWFSISSQLETILRSDEHPNRSTWMRLLWEAQSGMQKALNRKNSGRRHTMQEAAVLCILGFPSITVERKSSFSYSICPMVPPQDIHLSLSVGPDGTRFGMWVEAKCGQGNARRFHWARWRDAFFGRLSAQSTWRKNYGMPEKPLTIHSAGCLRNPIRSYKLRNTESDCVQEVAIWDGWRPHNPLIAFFEVSQLLSSSARGYSYAEDWVMLNATAALQAALSDEDEYEPSRPSQPSKGTSGAEHPGNVLVMYEKALELIEQGLPGDALEFLSSCVKQFEHAPSLQKMFHTVFQNYSFNREKVEFLIDAMCHGMELLSCRSEQDVREKYRKFSYEDLGLLFAAIYSKTKTFRALEYEGLAFLCKSKTGEPVDRRAVDAFQSFLQFDKNKAHLFLAICFQRNYLASQGDADGERDPISGRDALLASKHLSLWANSLDSKSARLSTGFLLEKGSCYGRDERRLSPILRLFNTDPIVKGLMMEQFLSKVNWNRIAVDLSSFPDPESLRIWLQKQIANQNTNGVEPDKLRAAEVYQQSHESNVAHMSQRHNGALDDLHVDIEPFAWNRLGLMNLKAPEKAKDMFSKAMKSGSTAVDSRSKSASCNNYGAVLQLGAKNIELQECQEAFERARNADLRIPGIGSRSSPSSSPAVTSANNLAVVKELLAKGNALVAAEASQLYEEAEREAHPAGMYNYAVYLMCGPERNRGKARDLLDRVLTIGNELIPMYNLISQAIFLRKRLQEDNFDVKKISWAAKFDEIDDCLASVKCIEYGTTGNTGSLFVDIPRTNGAKTENMSFPTDYVPGDDENV